MTQLAIRQDLNAGINPNATPPPTNNGGLLDSILNTGVSVLDILVNKGQPDTVVNNQNSSPSVQPKDNTLLYIGAGFVGLLVIAGIVFFATRNN